MLELTERLVPDAERVQRLALPDDPLPDADAIVSIGHVLNYLPDREAIDRALLGRALAMPLFAPHARATLVALATAVSVVSGALAASGAGAGGGAGSVYVQGRDDLELEPGAELTIRSTGPR